MFSDCKVQPHDSPLVSDKEDCKDEDEEGEEDGKDADLVETKFLLRTIKLSSHPGSFQFS